MRTFNEEKTQELFEVDEEMGYLRPGKLLIKHHDAIPEKVMKSVEEIRDELIAEGKEVKQYSGGVWKVTEEHYPATDTKPEGRTVKTIQPIIEPAKDAWDEYEDIRVYHPYTDEEYKDYLRRERERICFPVINRGAAWYARLTPEQNEELQAWYQAWLDVTETKVKPQTPEWV